MAITLERHVRMHSRAEIAPVFAALASAAVAIEAKLRTAALSGVLGAAGATNVQGEQQQKLDVFADEILLEALRDLPSVGAAISEEREEPVLLSEGPAAQLLAVFDPLDGSSNLDVNVNVGTIVSILPFVGGDPIASALRPGTAQIAALYVNYGPATTLVYTAGDGAHSFVLSEGEFVMTAEKLRMPLQGPFYSMNEGNLSACAPAYSAFVQGLRDGSLLDASYSSRYVGSFIADFHRTLLKGGIFLYPAAAKAPEGKLRLLYEANPLSFIAEQAGGAATNGDHRILDQQPAGIHARTPLAIGGQREVHALAELVRASEAATAGH